MYRRHDFSPTNGFALLEVLLAMLVAAIALLGLATLELRAVQSAQSSLDYAIATTQLNNLSEQLRANLCANRGTAATYQATVQAWTAGLPSGLSATVPASYADSMTLTLTWRDTRFATGNTVSLYPVFPAICS